ncbi:alpha-1,4-N-acetylglucosaminyltransferase-like [Dendropsophus ebraccatus]|uniref:alpha-1,4-N-acetylglucosaminyltransferase-like n=1 Tax=Dendropsophus ebraccatus TaxID=150705 RepID=UPI003831F2F6
MLKQIKIFVALVIIVVIGFLSRSSLKQSSGSVIDYLISKKLIVSSLLKEDELNEQTPTITPSAVLEKGNGILFVESVGKMDQSSIVLCSIESAALMYPDRPVVYFMKGLNNIYTEEDERKAQEHFLTLSSYKNIYFFPLKLEKLFADTPLLAWYEKVDPNKERYWIHVKSDACRFALIWKYGGIYMDTDVISIQQIPEVNFLAAEDDTYTGSSVFGMSPNHNLTWEFMEDFVQNYDGDIWGQQGPLLLTRIVNKYCGLPQFKSVDHMTCANISYFHRERCFPLPCASWDKVFEVVKTLPHFEHSYAIHLWNYMNREKRVMVPNSSTLLEHLYKKFCPSTYEAILNNKPLYQ